MLPEEYTAFVTADHGGHDRIHGTELPEDMTIPLLVYNPHLAPEEITDASILDIAPTITNLLGVAPDKEWEGHVLPLSYTR
jgi:type I phosphodiesterase/nucleotide pyrophosphatase